MFNNSEFLENLSNEKFKTPNITFIQNTFNFSNHLPSLVNEYLKLCFMANTNLSIESYKNDNFNIIKDNNIKQIDGNIEYEIIDDDENIFNKSEFLENLLKTPIYDKNNKEIIVPHISIKRTSSWKKDIYNHNIFLNKTYGLINLEVPNDKHHLILILDNFEEKKLNTDIKCIIEEIQNRINNTNIIFYIISEPHYTNDNETLLIPKEKSGDLFVPDLVTIHSVFSHKPRHFQVNPETYYKHYSQKIN